MHLNAIKFLVIINIQHSKELHFTPTVDISRHLFGGAR